MYVYLACHNFLSSVMNISCVICSDVFDPSSDVFGTPCGHLFHYQCLIQWFETSENCPQCRRETTEKTIYRLYFNVTNHEEGDDDDPTTLQNKIDNLKVEVQMREIDVKKSSEENKKLRDEIEILESSISVIDSANTTLQEKIQYLTLQEEESQKLRNKMEMLNMELVSSVEEKQQLIDRLKACQNDLNDANIDKEKLNEELSIISELNKHFEDKLQNMKHENGCLQERLHEVEKVITLPSGNDPKDAVLEITLSKRPFPKAAKRLKLCDPNEVTDVCTSTLAHSLEIKSQLPEEPQEGAGDSITKMRFRLPKGEFVVRRFQASAPLKVLLDFLMALGYPSDEYKVLSSWPRRDLTSLDSKLTLQELNLYPQESVILEKR